MNNRRIKIMIPTSNNQVVKAFIEGKAKSLKNTVSTGKELLLFGNKIAEWRKDGLYISTGGYSVYTRNGNEVIASNTTKARLRDLPNVRIWQEKSKVYLNGKEWDGNFIHIEGVELPANFDTSGNVFSMEKRYHKIDGWRGFEEYVYGVVAGNDTGTWDDSPCNSNVVERELNAVISKLHNAGIKTKRVTMPTSNVFCVSHQIIVKIKDVDAARKIVTEHLENNDTSIIYAIKGSEVNQVA